MSNIIDLDKKACEFEFEIVDTHQLRSDGVLRVLIQMRPSDIPQYAWFAETKNRGEFCRAIAERVSKGDVYDKKITRVSAKKRQ